MPFYVPGKNATIGATRADIEEYQTQLEAKAIPVDRGSTQQQSFRAWIRTKMKVLTHQEVNIEVIYANEPIALRHSTLGHDQALEREINPEEYVNLSDMNLSNGDFSNIKFSRVKIANTKLTDTNLFGATFEHMDFSSTNIQEAITDRGLVVYQDQNKIFLKQAQQDIINKKFTSFERYARIDTAKLKENAEMANAGTLNKFTHETLNWFQKNLFLAKEYDTIDTDAAFNIVRLQNVTGKNKSTKNLEQLEQISAEYIGKIFDQEFDKKYPKGWRLLAQENTDKKDPTRQAIIEEFKKDKYLRQEFLPHADKKALQYFFQDRMETLIKGDAPEAVRSLKAAQQAGEQRWMVLQGSSDQHTTANRHISKTSDTYVARAKKRVREAGYDIENAIPVTISPYKPSSWPAIDPKDTKAFARDIELKRLGLQTLVAASAATGGTLLTTLSRFYPATSMLVTAITPVQGAAIGAAAGGD